LMDETLRQNLSANCREVAEREFSTDVEAKRFVELYEEVLH